MAIRSFAQHTPQVDPTAWVDDSAVVIGQVRVGADSSVWPLTVVRGDINAITIGMRSNIQDGSVLHVTHDSEYAPGGYALSIGDDVTIGHKVILHACTIGNRCLVGMGSTVLDGVVFEDEVMLGAHSLVSPGKVLESGYLYLGAPARKARALTDRERAFLRYSATHYVELKNRYCA
ncbi:MAG: gamma carbonic anhydrase family protein [Granulosicoccaceae bacterium]|jgi:carbonic anhydrase/acetyltransferase-like protein (isoleucine patch superfamily)